MDCVFIPRNFFFCFWMDVKVMKTILITAFLLSSCSILDTATKAITVPYDMGKFHGRQEVLDELAKNKKKLNDLKKIVAHQLLDLSFEKEKEVMTLLPGLMSVAQLLENRKALKKRLKDVSTSELE